MRVAIRVLYLLALACMSASGDEPTYAGRVADEPGRRDVQAGRRWLVATFANSQIPPVKGSLTGKTATLKSGRGQNRGEAKLTLDDSGRSFAGSFRFGNGRQNPWNGWRPDPDATKAETGRFDGLWLTTTGLMELEQTGDKVHGTLRVAGHLKDRRDCHRPPARLPLPVVPSREGLVRPEQGRQEARGRGRRRRSEYWYGWRGRRRRSTAGTSRSRRARSFNGSTKDCSPTASAPPRATRRVIPNDGRPSSILHGSNMNGNDYVNTIGDGVAGHRSRLRDPGHQRRDSFGPSARSPGSTTATSTTSAAAPIGDSPARTARAPPWWPRPSPI